MGAFKVEEKICCDKPTPSVYLLIGLCCFIFQNTAKEQFFHPTLANCCPLKWNILTGFFVAAIWTLQGIPSWITTTVHTGRWSTRLQHRPEQVSSFIDMTLSVPVDFAGQTIPLSEGLCPQKKEAVTRFFSPFCFKKLINITVKQIQLYNLNYWAILKLTANCSSNNLPSLRC